MHLLSSFSSHILFVADKTVTSSSNRSYVLLNRLPKEEVKMKKLSCQFDFINNVYYQKKYLRSVSGSCDIKLSCFIIWSEKYIDTT